MPVSKNRKGHAQKIAYRNTRIQERKNRAENMYGEMMSQLRDKSLSVPDMLNKEEVGAPPHGPEQTTIT